MIYAISNLLLIPKVMELAKDMEGADLPALEKMLLKSLGRKDALLLISEKGNSFNGFLFASIEEVEGEDAVFIQSCVIRPDQNEKNIGDELLAKIRKWGQGLGVKDIYFMTRRNPKAFQRKYHFRYHTTVLKRSI